MMKNTIKYTLAILTSFLSFSLFAETEAIPSEHKESHFRLQLPITSWALKGAQTNDAVDIEFPYLYKIFLGVAVGFEVLPKVDVELNAGLGAGLSVQGLGRYYFISRTELFQPYLVGGVGYLTYARPLEDDAENLRGAMFSGGAGLRLKLSRGFSLNSQVLLNQLYAKYTNDKQFSTDISEKTIMTFPAVEVLGLEWIF